MFHDAVSRLGGAPFITYYDADSRIELSGTTFANWVAKTANLFDDLGGDVDEPLSLGLAQTHPGHWVTLIWAAAAWFAGGGVVPDVGPGAGFAVVGPADDRRGATTVACSLHPLGRGFDELPAGTVDFADVLAQPDAAFGQPADAEAPAWGGVTHRELQSVGGRKDRRLFVDPEPGWGLVADALVSPLVGGGSSVVVVGLDEDAVARVRTSERTG